MPGDFAHWVFLLCMLMVPVVIALFSIADAIRNHTAYVQKRDAIAARDRETARREYEMTRPPNGYRRTS